MVKDTFSFVTDTATFCVFDPVCLKHRLNDDADWWSLTSAELEEENRGNVVFIGLPGDGEYSIAILDAVLQPSCEVNLRCPSGLLFLGAGEEVTSDGLEPEAVRGGGFVNMKPGNYKIAVKRDRMSLFISFSLQENGCNNLIKPIRI